MSIEFKTNRIISAAVTEEYKFLPEKHWFSHDYCKMLLDLLTQVIVEGDKAGAFNIHIKDESKEFQKKLENANGKDIVTLLEEDGKFAEVFLLLYKQITAGVLSDMIHFIYEALECSKKGKLTVTFSLLRKPFVENLLYLEYLLCSPGEFIFHFWKGDIDHFGLGQRQVLDPLHLIRTIYETLPLPRFEEPEFIYELRYKKDSEQSFQTYFQKATHLVTQSKAYKTENTNFNFLYSGTDENNSQWDGLYAYVPILLFHTFQIVEALTTLIGTKAGARLDITQHRVAVGYILWEKYSLWGDFGAEDKSARLTEIYDLSKIFCSFCNEKISPSLSNYRLFYEKGHIECDACAKTNDLIAPFVELAQKELAEERTRLRN